MSADPAAVRRALDRVSRDEDARLVAALARRFRDLQLAEEAVQDAYARALETWPNSGIPDNPAAWLLRTAGNRALDALRREATLARKLGVLGAELEHVTEPDPAALVEAADLGAGTAAGIPDDRLGLFYACAHPVLNEEDRLALTLRFLAGLTTVEVAHALLVPVPTMQQRLVRVKKRMRSLGVPFGLPDSEELPGRTASVLKVVYLLFTEGYARTTGDTHVRTDLSAEAIRLARILHTLLPADAEATGLLALLVLTDSRRAARTDAAGFPVPLADQDRTLWDSVAIAEGTLLAEAAAGTEGADSYAIQAAIAAVHAEATEDSATDWKQIAVLYAMLERTEPSPVVRLGRAVARGKAHGSRLGLRELDVLADDPVLGKLRAFHVARALTLVDLGEENAAAEAYRRALDLPGNAAETSFLASALAGLENPESRIGR